MAGLIAMISVFLVMVVEMFFSIMNGGSMGGCHGGHGYERLEDAASPSLGRQRAGSSASEAGLADFTSRGGISRPIHRRSGSIGRQLQQIELSENQEGATSASRDSLAGSHDASVYPRSYDSDSEEDGVTELRTLNPPRKRPTRSPGSSREGVASGNGSILTEEQQQKKNMLQLLLLEAGILFHSVFIGSDSLLHTGIWRLTSSQGWRCPLQRVRISWFFW
jgi:zinc transporter 1/2/3